MEDLNSETETNLASNKDMNSTTTLNELSLKSEEKNEIKEKEINLIQNLSKDKLYEYKPEEITLNKKIIIDSIILYNKLSTNYGDKNIDIAHLSEAQQEKALKEIELILLTGKKIVHINDLDIFINLKELYLNQNYIKEIKGLNNLINLQVLNISFNNITKIENILHLNNLMILDLSNNLIEDFEDNLIPKNNLIYIYMYQNPFFKKINILEYRSNIISNFEKIERIDKLQIKDRERLLLIDKSNLKYENRLKSLDYIKIHYENYNKNNQEIFNMFKAKIDSDIEKVLNKKEKKEKKLENKIDIKTITTTFEPHNDPEDKQILKDIKELKNQSEIFYKESILSIQNRKNQIIEKYVKNQKKFMESDNIKKLQAQIDLLNEKFKKANFIDPEIKKKFEERVKEAIKFKERITRAEEITNKILDDFNKKELNIKSKNKKKELEMIPEEENKNEDNNNKEKNKDIEEYKKKFNEIKFDDSDDENK